VRTATATTTHLLDTNICAYLMRKKPPSVVERLAALGPRNVAVSVVTAIELRTGAELASAPAKYHRLLDVFLGEVPVLPLDERVVEATASIRAQLRRVGKPIGELDALIAGHAVALDLVLVTHNTREFARVGGLTLEDWA
jgi:tRNA(fMet)-specific endonuclease VapC